MEKSKYQDGNYLVMDEQHLNFSAMKKVLLPFLLICFFASCKPGTSSSDDCYEEADTTKYGLLGSWYKVGISEGMVNKIECFQIDTTGIKTNMLNELSFTISNKQYSFQGIGGSNCTYAISKDYRTLYNYDFGGDTTSDTTETIIGLLNKEYLVLIHPADTTFFKDAKTTSILYQRK
jgi:hypothetical protein